MQAQWQQRNYQRIAQAIHFLSEQGLAQPNLAEVAAQVHLSEAHFQRLFSQWVGISPKRFVQFITQQQAKQFLRQQQSTLEVSQQVGLSGSSRLYDLCINIEAATPGEIKAQGRGLVIDYGWGMTPFGLAFIAHTERGICLLNFCDDDQQLPLQRLAKDWPKAELRQSSSSGALLQELFSQHRAEPVSLWLKGTNFQVQVWQALLGLQQGQLAAYADIANKIGRSSASRAVANAIGANPVACLIPCHRVILSSGALGGYHWGAERKQLILAKELAPALECAAS